MGSTERDTSIASSSIFIPNWVKNKLENSGFDPSALSPPTHDSEFFYVKFPKTEKPESNHHHHHHHHQPGGERIATAGQLLGSRQFIPIVTDPVKPNILKAIEAEDMSVGQKIISGGGKSPVRGFTTDDAGSDKPSGAYLRQRRNSKSLPSSPLVSPETSPRTRRKNTTTFALQNRFAASSLVECDENADKRSKPSWILSGLFSRDVTLNSVAADGRPDNRPNLNVTLEVKQSSISADASIDKKVYRKKRSEIRELNIMSPISM